MAKSKKKRKSNKSKFSEQAVNPSERVSSDESSAIKVTGDVNEHRDVEAEHTQWFRQVRGFGLALFREPVAIGLALFVLCRPWKDGLTYEHFNIYFTIWIFMITTLFVVRLLIRGDRIRHPIPLAIFAAYLVVHYFSMNAGIDYDASLRAVILQISYFSIFLLASNGIRTKLAIGIVLGALVTTSFVNTVWAVMHAEYILPYVRESIKANPDLLAYHFNGATTISPELKNRLEMGRAFGTFLFPNALGGFLALCVPYMLGEALSSIRRFRDAVNADKPEGGIENSSFAVMLIVALAAFGMGMYVYAVNMFLSANTQGDLNLIATTARAIIFLGVFPGAFGLIGGYIVYLKGGVAYGRILRTLIVFLTFGIQTYGLWLTYSRGAYLGTLVGLTLAMFLVYSGTAMPDKLNPVARLWVRALLLLVIAGMFWNPSVKAEDMRDGGFFLPNTSIDYRRPGIEYDIADLNVEGTEVEISHIVNPRSMDFRWTYWKVSLLIARDNLFLGVGPGNYGTVYGTYQYIDAHDVRMAHNDFIHALVETGISGFVLFVGFWAYFILWGGARVLRESDPYQRMVLAGMYGGVVAFLVHAFFDFHFTNAALASLVYVMAGLFFARVHLVSETSAEDDAKHVRPLRLTRLAAACGIMVLFLSTSAAARQFLYDFGRTEGESSYRFSRIGDNLFTNLHYDTMYFLLDKPVQSFRHGQKDANGERIHPPQRVVQDFKYLLESYDDLLPLGRVRPLVGTPSPGDTRRRPTRELLEGEEITDLCYLFVTEPAEARKLAYKITDTVMARLDELDEFYPHGNDICEDGYRWTRYVSAMAFQYGDHDQHLKYSTMCLAWARRAVERSPGKAKAHLYLSGALIERGKVSELGQLDYYRESARAFRKGISLYPTAHALTQQFGDTLTRLGNAFVQAGIEGERDDIKAEGDAFRAEAREAYLRASLMAEYRRDVLGLQ